MLKTVRYNSRYGEKRMRKFKVVLLLSVMTAFMALATVNPAHAWVNGHNWIGSLLKNQSDDFLGYVYEGYQTGTTATLIVNVYNHLSHTMNISAVYVNFDWGKVNYSSPEANITATLIYHLQPGQSHVFTITFTVPDTSVASNLVLHSYWIYAEDVNAVGSKLYSNGSPADSGSYFAVLSDDQTTAINTARQIDTYQSMYYMFLSSEGRRLSLLANGESNQGDDTYERGDFAGAVTLYQQSLSDYQDAWGNETDMIGGFETTGHDLMVSAQGAVNMIGWGYLIFGLGWVFIGIGVIIYSLKKQSKAAAQS
jgi:hypothetical protein